MEIETRIPVIRHAQLLRLVRNQNLDLDEEDELKQVGRFFCWCETKTLTRSRKVPLYLHFSKFDLDEGDELRQVGRFFCRETKILTRSRKIDSGRQEPLYLHIPNLTLMRTMSSDR